MADKKFKAPEKYFWADDSRTFGGQYNFGDEMSGVLDEDPRLEGWIEDGTVSEEKPESEARADQSKLLKMQLKIDQQKSKIEDLENDVKNQPKNIAKAKAKIKKLEAKLADLPEGVEESAKIIEGLEKQVIELDVEKDNLSSQVAELTKTIEELTKPGDK